MVTDSKADAGVAPLSRKRVLGVTAPIPPSARMNPAEDPQIDHTPVTDAQTQSAPPDRLQTAISFVGFACSLTAWRFVLLGGFSPRKNAVIAWLCPAAVALIARGGRCALDRAHGLVLVARITAIVQFLIMTLLGSAVIAAVNLALQSAWGRFPFPLTLARVLVWITGIAVGFTVFNLAVRGIGAPFAIVLSGRLATEWAYAYTRNPMVLCMFAFLIALALQLQSAILLLWNATAAIPVMIWYLKVFEERELGLRFGAGYEEYRRRVPILWPRRPRKM